MMIVLGLAMFEEQKIEQGIDMDICTGISKVK